MSQANTGLAVGLNKGHQVTKKEKVPRQANKKGVSVLRLLRVQSSRSKRLQATYGFTAVCSLSCDHLMFLSCVLIYVNGVYCREPPSAPSSSVISSGK